METDWKEIGRKAYTAYMKHCDVVGAWDNLLSISRDGWAAAAQEAVRAHAAAVCYPADSTVKLADLDALMPRGIDLPPTELFGRKIDDPPRLYTPADDCDVDTVVNERGGKQARIDERFDLLPHLALHVIAGVVARGAKRHGEGNWHLIPTMDHINHAEAHLNKMHRHIAGEDHLAHAACRLLFALETDRETVKELEAHGEADKTVS